MVFKLNISDSKGKAWKLEMEETSLVGRSVGDKFEGKEIGADYEGYEFEITGGSDASGFPLSKDVVGSGFSKPLLTRGFAMNDKRRGIRLRKTVRGKQISEKTNQINIKVLQEGGKKLEEIFPDQNKKPEVVKEEVNNFKIPIILRKISICLRGIQTFNCQSNSKIIPSPNILINNFSS